MKRVAPPVLDSSSRDLLLLLGEELKRPLVAISQLAELQDEKATGVIVHASQALNTIDNILFFQRVSSGQTSLKLEPVHVGSAMHDVAQVMEPVMKASGCRTELVVQHGLSPVDVDKKLLTSALVSLWQGFMNTVTEPSEVICRARKTSNGIRLSLQSSGSGINEIKLSGGNRKSIQPIKGLAGPATDILTAQGMFNLLGAELRRSSSGSSVGFGVTLKVSRQLQMV